MEWESILKIAELGATVTTVALFIWYLYQKNGKHERAMQGVADALSKLHRSQEVHTRVLMRVARQHGHNNDADDLMGGVE